MDVCLKGMWETRQSDGQAFRQREPLRDECLLFLGQAIKTRSHEPHPLLPRDTVAEQAREAWLTC